jgi:hypothetical protein
MEFFMKPLSAQALPTEVENAAQEAQLGELVQVFSTDSQHIQFSLKMEDILLVSLCSIFIALCLLLLFGYLPVYAWIGPVLWLPLMLGLVSSRSQSRTWRKGAKGFVYLYERGLITTLLFQEKREMDVVSWQQVLAVWSPRGKGCLLSYADASGQEMLLHIQKIIKDYDLLAEHVRSQIARVMLPKYLRDYEQGKACSFGWLRTWDDDRVIVEPSFWVAQQGFQYKQRFLPWNALASIEIKGNRLIILARNGSTVPWANVSTHFVSNSEVLYRLVSRILRQRDEK